MKFHYNDGGRENAGYKGQAKDCAIRSISIATKKPYKEVYKDIHILGKNERISERKPDKSSAKNGVYNTTIRKYMKTLGWTWVPTMFIGSGCKVHLKENELPKGRLVVSLSKHLTAVINGTINDTYDPSINGTRCVYGYYIKKNKKLVNK